MSIKNEDGILLLKLLKYLFYFSLVSTFIFLKIRAKNNFFCLGPFFTIFVQLTKICYMYCLILYDT